MLALPEMLAFLVYYVGAPPFRSELHRMTDETPNILEALERRRFGPRMKRALMRVFEGESYRSAAEAEGIDHADVFKAARSIPGLRESHLRAWRDGWGEAFPSAWRHHLARIEPRGRIPKAS
jgi:hypothetical protein